MRGCLGIGGGGPPGPVAAERIGEGFGLSSELLRVRLDAQEAPQSVVVKLWSTEAAPADREAQVLRVLAERSGPRVPACYHAAVDEEAGRAVAVLEDLGEVEQGDATEDLDAGPAARMARVLAALHATGWGDAALADTSGLARSPWLGLGQGWFPPRAALALERFGDRLSAPAKRMLERLGEVYPRAIARLDAAPATLLHDDLHLDNVVFDRATGAPILLDWARAAIGPAALDLAELLVMVVAPGMTDSLLATYRHELVERGVEASEAAGLEEAVAAAVVVCFVKGTCGVARWAAESPREARLLDRIVDRADRGLLEWRERDPELLADHAG